MSTTDSNSAKITTVGLTQPCTQALADTRPPKLNSWITHCPQALNSLGVVFWLVGIYAQWYPLKTVDISGLAPRSQTNISGRHRQCGHWYRSSTPTLPRSGKVWDHRPQFTFGSGRASFENILRSSSRDRGQRFPLALLSVASSPAKTWCRDR